MVIHVEGQPRTYAVPDDCTIHDLAGRLAGAWILSRKGAIMAHEVLVAIISDPTFYVEESSDGLSVLRSWTVVWGATIITLAELCEWFGEPIIEPSAGNGAFEHRASRWKRHLAIHPGQLSIVDSIPGMGQTRQRGSLFEAPFLKNAQNGGNFNHVSRPFLEKCLKPGTC